MVRLGYDDEDDDEEEVLGDEDKGGEEGAGEEDAAMQVVDDAEDPGPTLLESAADDAAMLDSPSGAAADTRVQEGARAWGTHASAEVELMRAALDLGTAEAWAHDGWAHLDSLAQPPPQPLVPAPLAGPGVKALLAAAARRPTIVPPLVEPCAADGDRSLCARLLAERPFGAHAAAAGGTLARSLDPLLMLGHTRPVSWGPDGCLVVVKLHAQGPLRGRPDVELVPQAQWRTPDASAPLDVEALTAAGGDEAAAADAHRLRLSSLLRVHCESLVPLAAAAAAAEAAGVPASAQEELPARVAALCDAYARAEAEAAGAAMGGAPSAHAGDGGACTDAATATGRLGGSAGSVARPREQLWELLSALWGDKGAFAVRSEEAVAQWLRHLAREAGREALAWPAGGGEMAGGPAASAPAPTPDPLQRVFFSLCCLDVADAARAARDAGYPRLGLLVSLAGSTTSVTHAAREQLAAWEAAGASAFVAPGLRRVLLLLAGEVLAPEVDARSLAWTQALALCWWFDRTGADGGGPRSDDEVPNRLLRHALRRYRAGVQADLLPPPHASHRAAALAAGAADEGRGNRDAAGASDTLLEILCLATDAMRPLPTALSPYGIESRALRVATVWHAHEVLWRVLRRRPLPPHSCGLLQSTAVAELLGAGAWPLAVYLSAQAAPSAVGMAWRRAMALEIIRRNAAPPPPAAGRPDDAPNPTAASPPADAAVGPHGRKQRGAYADLTRALSASSPAARDALTAEECECLRLIESLPASATALSAEDAFLALHEAKADAAGAARRVRPHLFHLLAARRWERAHRLVVAQVAPRVLLGALFAETIGREAEAQAARDELAGVLRGLAVQAAELDGWATGGLVVLRFLNLCAAKAISLLGEDGAGEEAEREAAGLEAAAKELLAAVSRWAPERHRAIRSAGASAVRELGGHAGGGGHAAWVGEAASHEALIIRLCDVVLDARQQLQSQRACPVTGSGEGGVCLTPDLVGYRLPSDKRLAVAWRALDELLEFHARGAAPQ